MDLGPLYSPTRLLARPSAALRFLWFPQAAGLLGATLRAEGERLHLWIPVSFGIGIAIYFSLPVELPPWLGGVLVALAAGLTWRLRGRFLACVLVGGIGLVTLGLSVAQLRTWTVEAPVLTRTLSYTGLSGRVVSVEPGARARIVLEELEIDRLPSTRTPERVRIRLLPDETVRAGDVVRLRARLSPPPGPAAPGAFDFARQAWFERLGGVGFAFGRIERLEADEDRGFAAVVESMRQDIRDRVLVVAETGWLSIDDGAAGVMAALLTGLRGDVRDADQEAMRRAGLAHLLAISGLHIGLVAAFVLFTVRGGFALVPWIALRYPVKKWAAVIALGVAAVYLALSGATVPTQRAFLMLSIALVAILFDRLEVSMRPVAWAAFVILLLFPETLVTASFQLSFAAVVALVASYEVWSRYRRNRGEATRRRGGPGAYVAGVAATSVIASLATAPFALYHFSQVAALGIVANLVAVPLMAAVIMPAGLLALVSMPLGVDAPMLAVMGLAVEGMLWVAHLAADLPGAALRLPAMPAWAISLVALGGLWAALWQGRWRRWGLVPLVIGLASLAIVRPPDILIDARGDRRGVADGTGGWWIEGRPSAYVADVWARRAGTRSVRRWPSADAVPVGKDGGRRLVCDDLGCMLRTPDGLEIALPSDGRALEDDCRTAAAVIATVPVRGWRRTRTCSGVKTVIDRIDLRRRGSHAIWIESDGIRVRSAADSSGVRPWTPWNRPAGGDGQ